jgi:hypothetical protein
VPAGRPASLGGRGHCGRMNRACRRVIADPACLGPTPRASQVRTRGDPGPAGSPALLAPCPVRSAPASGVKGVKVPLLPFFGVLCATDLFPRSRARVPGGRMLRRGRGWGHWARAAAVGHRGDHGVPEDEPRDAWDGSSGCAANFTDCRWLSRLRPALGLMWSGRTSGGQQSMRKMPAANAFDASAVLLATSNRRIIAPM